MLIGTIIVLLLICLVLAVSVGYLLFGLDEIREVLEGVRLYLHSLNETLGRDE